MQFSVIYSADTPGDVDVLAYAPPDLDLWDETEDDDQYEYGYLEGSWEQGHHRKWCAILDREQFEEFIDELGFVGETTETMGSLGAPGLGFGLSPAISFRADDPDAILDAYVTPVPEVRKKHGTDRDWKRIRGAVLAMYG